MHFSNSFMELSRAKELINKFDQHKVLVVGDVVLDHYIHGVVERINPEAPVPILRATMEREETGAAGNTAKNLARLGAETILVSVVGDDETAAVIKETANREGYRAILIRDKERPSIRKERYLVGNQHMLRVDFEEVKDINSDIEKKVIAEIRKVITEGVDAVIVSDYAKGLVTKKIAEVVLDEAGQRDILVGADVKPSRASYFTGATFISPNVREAHEFLGLNYHEQQVPPAELAKMVYVKMCANVFLTLGKEGMYVYCGGEHGHYIPQSNVIEVADESGAGDTAAAVILLSMLSGACENEAAELSNAGGAVVVSKVGSVGISTDEIYEMMTKNGVKDEQTEIKMVDEAI
jgi:rfaE bifunctional protein kinase chain/domain